MFVTILMRGGKARSRLVSVSRNARTSGLDIGGLVPELEELGGLGGTEEFSCSRLDCCRSLVDSCVGRLSRKLTGVEGADEDLLARASRYLRSASTSSAVSGELPQNNAV
jgi:hypothetical protein